MVPTDDLGEVRLESGTYVVRIDPSIKFTRAFSKLVLLHEMAHIKVWPYEWHGIQFNEEMLRLAQLGALRGLW